jgi:acyl-CoA reductase-like NAD-dependent aldehyde dehydrogenase
MDKLTVLAAYDEKLIQQLDFLSDQDMEKIIDNADSLFKDKKSRLSKARRIQILEKVAVGLENEKFDFVKLMALEGGKPFKDAEVEADRAIWGIKTAIGSISGRQKRLIPMGITESTENRMAWTVDEPIGLVLGISAFNHPLNMIVHQVIPALAAGCPIFIKPSLKTPLTCLKFVELLYKSGVPQNYCQAIICKDSQISKLVSNSKFKFCSFIGSSEVGWELKKQMHEQTQCVLEHGGAAPLIIDKDVNLKDLIEPIVKSAFYHAGQVCVSLQRLFIPEAMEELLLQDLIPRVQALKVGDPISKDTDVGPMITYLAVERVNTWINEAKNSGAKIAVGGDRLSRTCLSPTIIVNPDTNLNVSKEEIFGPVLNIYTYKTLDEAFEKANSLEFAFQSSFYSNNIENCMRASTELEAATVLLNDHCSFRADWMPFGGYKNSGFGMGGIHEFIDYHYREKLLILKSKSIPVF